MNNLDLRTRSGRLITITSLSLNQTFSGVAEGDSETASAKVLRDLNKKATKASDTSWPIVIVDADEDPLPPYLLKLKLRSSRGVHETDPDYCSRVVCIHFVDSTARSIDEIVQEALAGFDWEKEAADYNMMDF